MKDYVAGDWQPLLQANGLDSFDALWDLDIGWFEAPNRRRGGWSGVSRCKLELAQGGQAGVFIKRQENHVSRTPMHPLRGMLTFVREFHRLQQYRALGIPTLETVYFARRKVDGKRRAILVTRELSGYTSLADCMENWRRQGWPKRLVRHALIKRLAGIAAQMHRHRLQHNCFYPKHIFVRDTDDELDVRIIDLEKTKWRLNRTRAMLRDLDTLNRHTPGWSRTDRLRFLLAYTGWNKVDKNVRVIWEKLGAMSNKKMPD